MNNKRERCKHGFYLIEVHVYFCKDEVQKCNGMHGMDVDHACEDVAEWIK